ncbi:MAG: thiamine pyrophosphate-dependent enzyme [Anderseniella sp.]|jgi:thiamine pyrophosphate-dependent acetolactate synthase large subunit-like protein|nr:thiamine pyrophosphate-dependent enzyme [Anderseniella sp.]
MIERREAVAGLLKDRPEELLVVTGLGSPTYDVAAAGDVDRNFYLWGAMGGAASMGLGLAQARPGSRVAVITGDGEMLMGLGSLATIGAKQPANLAILVIDNEAFGETGGQTSHTGQTTNLAAVALACGFRKVITVRKPEELAGVRQLLLEEKGPVLAVVKTRAGELPRVLPERDGHAIRLRFKAALAKP